MSSRVAGVKPFSANTSSAASRSSERVCSMRRSRVHRSAMRTIVPRDLRNSFPFQIPAGIFPAMANRKNAPAVTETLGGVATLEADDQRTVRPVTIWATIGGAVLALQVYVWIRWITGPYFERVPGGPTDPPMYMKVMLT